MNPVNSGVTINGLKSSSPMVASSTMFAFLKRRAAMPFLRSSLAYARASLGGPVGGRHFEKICVVANLGKRDGIAKGAKLQYESLKRIGVDAQLLDVTASLRNPLKRIAHMPATAYIFHSGGPQIATLLTSVLPHARNAYRIAYWAWELPIPPKGWPEPEGVVSEIWTCSQFAKQSLEKGFKVPVFVVPHVVDVNPAGNARKSDHFKVLVLADSRSSVSRKNPAASIRAFKRAFKDVDSARLIIKFNGAMDDLDDLLGPEEERQKITIINEFLDDNEMANLYSSVNVLISLHRAEGFGLPMLEAMAAGTPVVASRWSGNLDFMNDENSLLVDCAQVPLSDQTVYSGYEDASWAEPDVDKAAAALLHLYSDPSACRTIGLKGQDAATKLIEEWRLP